MTTEPSNLAPHADLYASIRAVLLTVSKAAKPAQNMANVC